MGTVLSLEQGGTGVQSVSALKKDVLKLGDAADKSVSNSYNDDSHDSVPSSYALSAGLNAIKSSTISGVIPIEKGGTGATTAEDAVKNLGIENTTIQYPVPVRNGGTGAVTAEQALINLGITFPLEVSMGGTGATSAETFIQSIFGSNALPETYGGTGAQSAYEFFQNAGFSLPITVGNGGTGATTILDARKNLQLNYLSVNYIYGSVVSGTEITNLNNAKKPGLYKSVRSSGEIAQIANKPSDLAFTMIVIADDDLADGMSGRLSQILIDDENRMYSRFFIRTSGNDGETQTETWTPWVKYVSSRDLYEWEWNTVSNGTSYGPTSSQPALPNPAYGIYHVFLDGSKLSKTEFTINTTTNKVQLTTPTTSGKVLSVTYIG